MSLGGFFESLLENYFKLRDSINPYVPIPELRKAVCRELGISPKEFDQKLIQLIRQRQVGNWLIDAASPRARRKGGLVFGIGEKYIYYLAILKGG